MLSWNRRRCAPHFLLALGVGLALAAPASAGTLYRWRTDEGGYAFTDDAKRIPERYRSRVEQTETRSLAAYERFTPQDAAATQTQSERLAARLERLRALNAELDAREELAAAPAAAGTRAASVRVGTRNGASVEVSTEDDSKPIVIEERRFRMEDSFVTRHNTVVRQGDRVIAIVKPRPNVIGSSDTSRIVDERELER